MRSEDKQAVMQAAEDFYAALNAMFKGDLRLMTEVWSHEDDVVYMGPNGNFRIGWAAVLADWEEQAAMNLGGAIRPTGMRVTLGQDLAVTHSLEQGSNVDADGNALNVAIRATNLFRKERGRWKMVGHHTDPLPFLQE